MLETFEGFLHVYGMCMGFGVWIPIIVVIYSILKKSIF